VKAAVKGIELLLVVARIIGKAFQVWKDVGVDTVDVVESVISDQSVALLNPFLTIPVVRRPRIGPNTIV
jgi:hypothetical protein